MLQHNLLAWTTPLFFIVAYPVAPAFSQVDRPIKEPPESVGFRRDVIPVADIRGFESYLGGVVTVDGVRYARGGFIHFFTKDGYGYRMRFPELRLHDIVPMFKSAYIVLGVVDGDSPSVGFFRLPAGEYKLPEEAKVGEGEYVFAVGLGGGGELHGASFRADYVTPEGGNGPGVKIDIFFQQPSNGRVKVEERRGIQVVRVGDELRIGNTTYKVVNIVPPNKETQVIGWFEISRK